MAPKTNSRIPLLLARLTFLAAILVVADGVFSPPGSGPSLMPWDKAEHFTAFYGLAFLGLFAFPGWKVFRLGLALSLAGAAIEVIQATPWVRRDADVWDWLADTLGILAAMAPLWAPRWRRWTEPKNVR